MIGVFSSLFNHRKPKRFGYKPIYYNEENEFKDAREKRIKSEIEDEALNGEFRKLLREKWRKNYVVLANKKSNIRIIIIAVILAVICYIFLKT